MTRFSFVSPLICRTCENRASPKSRVVRNQRLRICLHRLIRRIEQDVPIHSNREFVSHRNLDRRLDIQIAARDHRTRLAHLAADGRACRIANARIGQATSICLPLTQIERRLNMLVIAAKPNSRL